MVRSGKRPDSARGAGEAGAAFGAEGSAVDGGGAGGVDDGVADDGEERRREGRHWRCRGTEGAVEAGGEDFAAEAAEDGEAEQQAVFRQAGAGPF